MFLNKMKEQLSPDNKGSPSFPHSSHYPTAVLTMDAGGRVVPKQEGGGVQLNAVGGHLHQPHTSQNITVVPVQSTGIMTAGEKTRHTASVRLSGNPLWLFYVYLFPVSVWLNHVIVMSVKRSLYFIGCLVCASALSWRGMVQSGHRLSLPLSGASDNHSPRHPGLSTHLHTIFRARTPCQHHDSVRTTPHKHR